MFICSSIKGLAQKPTASFSYMGNCENVDIQFFTTSYSSNTSRTIVDFDWDFGTGRTQDTSNEGSPRFQYLDTSGNFQVTLTVTDNAGESDDTSILVRIDPAPKASFSINTPCIPDPVLFDDSSTVSSGTIIGRLWTIESATGTALQMSYTPTMAGTYSMRLDAVSDKNCKTSLTQEFSYGEKPTVSFSRTSPVIICENDSVTITASGAQSYIWDNGDTSRTIRLEDSRFYKVTGYTGTNCFDTDSIEVQVNPNPVADAGEDITLNLGESTLLLGNGGANYIWSPDTYLSDPFIAMPESKPTESITYTLTVANTEGCSDNDSVTITVDQNATIPIHNMITPNGDGLNDKWDLSSVPDLANMKVSVINRWGWEVYTSTDYQNNWNGTFENEPLQDGSYIYVLEYKTGEKDPIRGVLEILRNTQK